MKFGGTSIGNAERIENVANIIKGYAKKKPVVIVSAITKITDALVKLANECSKKNGEEILEYIKKTHYQIIERLGINKGLLDKDIEELSNLVDKIKSKIKSVKNSSIDSKIFDYFQSFGEIMSSKIVAEQLNKIGLKARAFNSFDLGFLTDSEFGNAEPLEVTYKNLKNNIEKLDIVPVITGFIGKTENGEITTLGRGGSDYTAVIIGAAIEADEIQIWTDVDGIMSAEPKIIRNARTLNNISFEEASELAYFGAKVLHPKTILPAMKKNIPVRVLNSLNKTNKGTVIFSKSSKTKKTVKAIAYKKNITLINIKSTRMLGTYGFLARIFHIFDEYKKSIDVISTSEVSVSLSIDNDENIEQIVNELKIIADVGIIKNNTIICIVGEGLIHTPGIAGRGLTALGKNKINIEMISQGASEINITIIVNDKDAEKSVRVLHKEYFN